MPILTNSQQNEDNSHQLPVEFHGQFPYRRHEHTQGGPEGVVDDHVMLIHSSVQEHGGDLKQEAMKQRRFHGASINRGPIKKNKIWHEFWLEKPLAFWLEIHYTKKKFNK